MWIGIDVSKAASPPDGLATSNLGLLRGLAEVASGERFRLYGLLWPVDRAALEARFGPLPERFELCAERQPAAGEVDVFQRGRFQWHQWGD